MIKFNLMVAVPHDTCFDDNCKWKSACACRVKDTGDHMSNWKKAHALFKVKAPHLMKDFGKGWIAIVSNTK